MYGEGAGWAVGKRLGIRIFVPQRTGRSEAGRSILLRLVLPYYICSILFLASSILQPCVMLGSSSSSIRLSIAIPLIITILTLGSLGYMFFSGRASSSSLTSYLQLVVGTLNGILTYLFLMQVVKFFAGEAYPARTRVARLKHFAGFVLLALLFGLGAGVGLVLFFVPGFYFLNRCFLAPMLYLDGKAGIFASFRESWTRTKGHFYTLLSALGIVLLLAAVNAVTLQLATVIILPVATLYLFILYRYLQEIPQDKTPAL